MKFTKGKYRTVNGTIVELSYPFHGFFWRGIWTNEGTKPPRHQYPWWQLENGNLRYKWYNSKSMGGDGKQHSNPDLDILERV